MEKLKKKNLQKLQKLCMMDKEKQEIIFEEKKHENKKI
jgi:hypothetical protein